MKQADKEIIGILQDIQALGGGEAAASHILTVYAAGTASSISTSSTALDFGTTDPVLVIDQPGTYRIDARVMVKVGPTDPGAAYITNFTLRRTNNTPEDIANSATSREDNTFLVTNFGSLAGYSITLPTVYYTTANADDSITIFANTTENIGGAATVTEASIVAEKK